MGLSESLPWRTSFPARRQVRADWNRPTTDADLAVLTEQVNIFDAEIRTALRSTTTTVTIALIVLTLGVSLTKDVSRDIAILVLFPLLALASAFQAQVAADVAVMAEVRDRLASIVNQASTYPLLNVRLVSDVRRFAMGTVGINAVMGLASAGGGVALLRYAWQRNALPTVFPGHSYRIVLLVVIVISFAAVCFAVADIGVGRKAILKHLDDVFGCATRPDHLLDEDHPACSDKPTPKLTECPCYTPPASGSGP